MTAPRQLARVVVWMTGALLSFSVMAVSIRELSATLSIMEILTVRAAIGLAIIGGIVAMRPRLRLMIGSGRFLRHLARNSIHFAAQYLWAMSLVLLPLATVFAMTLRPVSRANSSTIPFGKPLG